MDRVINFKADLNDEQYAAATAPDGPLLVLAAAGTGKTRTLVYRVAFLVNQQVAPERILLLTFTNRAAREMLERAESLIGTHVAGVWGGTFHHMANRILRRHADRIRYSRQFTILDRDDAEGLIAEGVKALRLNSKEFPKKDVLMSLFSSAANTEKSVESVVAERMPDESVLPEDVLSVHRFYMKRKSELDSMDFDDMLVNCLRLFRENPDVLESYQDWFRHVLVDEYQDTNTIQAELVDKLCARNGNVFVVGDDFQSIYSWRGANFMNIITFPKRYPATTIFKLETNYRSVPEILEVANVCIAGNPEQFQKTLRSTRDRSRKPVLAVLRDGQEQARYAIDVIRRMRRQGYKLSDMAILYRAHFHAMELQIELAREHIAYRITSGMRFFEQAHIKDVCCVLRLLQNPEDELAFVRFLSFLPGVGAKTATTLWAKLGRKFDAQSELQRVHLAGLLKPAALEVWKRIEPVLMAYRDEQLSEDGGEIIYRFVQVFYEKHAANVFENADSRMEDIRELILYTAKFESVSEFLTEMALLTNLDTEVESLENDGESVRLSTVHQAKGLEWPVVILLWMTDGMFPSQRSMAESGAGVSEERRLFYVAVTRAKDHLHLCTPEVRRMRDGGVMYCEPSRFVSELPPQLLTQVHPTLL